MRLPAIPDFYCIIEHEIREGRDDMTANAILQRIGILEKQLAELKFYVQQSNPSAISQHSASRKTLGELRGIWAGQGYSTEEDIDKSLYQFEWTEETTD